MNVKYTNLILLLVCGVVSLYGDGSWDPSSEEQRVEVADTMVQVGQQRPTEKPPVAPQYDNRFGFSYDRFVYERTAVNEIYFAADVWGSYWVGNGLSSSHHHKKGKFLEAEMRLGYNLFYNGRDHVTPLVGAGYMGFYDTRHIRLARIGYATAGFMYTHEFNSVFGLGLGLKGLTGAQLSHRAPKGFAWGSDLTVPIIFRFASKRRWDITLEPYWLHMKLRHHKTQEVLGSRGVLAYRF